MDVITGLIAFILYMVSTLGLFLRLKGQDFFNQKPIGYILLPGFAAIILHSFALFDRMAGANGLELGFFETASAVAMVISFLILLMSINRRTEILAVVILPISAITLLIQVFAPSSFLLPYNTPEGIKIHVLVSIIAYSLLALAACLSIVLSLQNKMLHNHHPGGLMKKLPPLQVMEKLLFDSILAGFIGLTIALVSGGVFLDDILAQHLLHKTILSIIAWLVFAVLLAGRYTLGWRGRTAIRWTLSGFISLMLAYFGSKFVLEFIIIS